MDKKLKHKIFIVVLISTAVVILVVGGYLLRQARQDQYNITELELTDREHVLLSAMQGSSIHSHLFEINEGIYEIRSYHYQLGYLTYERIILEEFEISEDHNLLAVVSSVVDEGLVRLNLSTNMISTIDLVEFEIDTESNMSVSGAISQNFYSIPSNEQVFASFVFTNSERYHAITLANISEMDEFDETVEFLASYDNVVIFTATRTD